MRSQAVLYLIIAVAYLVCGCQGLGTSPTGVPPVAEPKVVVLVIDGARYSETFGDPSHTWVPRLWNELRPQGTYLTQFRNRGITQTVPGHSSMLTGTWQTIPNDGSQRPDRPTVFEYLRQATSLPDSLVYLLSGKTKLVSCNWSTFPGYGAAFGAREALGYATDLAVYTDLIQILQQKKPRLIMACLPQVDWAGHTGVWEDYVAAITNADSLAAETWNYLQSDPYYAGQTFLFVTNDHGRHDDNNGGFQNHGDGCEGCRRLMFLALGPDVRVDHVSDGYYTQRDLCNTIGNIMDFPTPYSEGNMLWDIFKTVVTGIDPEADSHQNQVDIR
jgi:hypothetical protein